MGVPPNHPSHERPFQFFSTISETHGLFLVIFHAFSTPQKIQPLMVKPSIVNHPFLGYPHSRTPPKDGEDGPRMD